MPESTRRERLEKLNPTVLDVWKKFEDVAMHFNDLMMRWRLQAIGGLAALVTIAGFVVGDAATLGVRYRAMFLLSGTLAFVWMGVGYIDLFYYRKLLKGAVESIVAIERETDGALDLSTKIEEHAKGGATGAPWVFYVAGLIPLVFITAWAIYHLATIPAATLNAASGTSSGGVGGITGR